MLLISRKTGIAYTRKLRRTPEQTGEINSPEGEWEIMKLSKVIAEKNGPEHLESVAPGTTLREAARKMTELGTGALLVLKPGESTLHCSGLISKSDLVRAIAEEKVDPDKALVDDFMSRRLIVANISDQVDYVINVMLRHHIAHLPVIEGKAICSIVSKTDILNSMNEEKDIELQWLSDYTGSAGERHSVF